MIGELDREIALLDRRLTVLKSWRMREQQELVLAMAVEYSGDLVHADALVQAAGDVKAGGLVQEAALQATRQLIAKVEHADADETAKQDGVCAGGRGAQWCDLVAITTKSLKK